MTVMFAVPQTRKTDCQRHRIDGYALQGGVWACRACGEPESRHETTDETVARRKFDELKAAALAELAKPVSVVYSGKMGCMCGCKGHYRSTPRMISLITNRIKAQIEQATIYEPRGLMMVEGMFVAIDNAGLSEATRQYCAYTDGRTS